MLLRFTTRYVFLVLELAEKGEVQNYMRNVQRRPFTEDQARALMRPLLQAVKWVPAPPATFSL